MWFDLDIASVYSHCVLYSLVPMLIFLCIYGVNMSLLILLKVRENYIKHLRGYFTSYFTNCLKLLYVHCF